MSNTSLATLLLLASLLAPAARAADDNGTLPPGCATPLTRLASVGAATTPAPFVLRTGGYGQNIAHVVYENGKQTLVYFPYLEVMDAIRKDGLQLPFIDDDVLRFYDHLMEDYLRHGGKIALAPVTRPTKPGQPTHEFTPETIAALARHARTAEIAHQWQPKGYGTNMQMSVLQQGKLKSVPLNYDSLSDALRARGSLVPAQEDMLHVHDRAVSNYLASGGHLKVIKRKGPPSPSSAPYVLTADSERRIANNTAHYQLTTWYQPKGYGTAIYDLVAIEGKLTPVWPSQKDLMDELSRRGVAPQILGDTAHDFYHQTLAGYVAAGGRLETQPAQVVRPGTPEREYTPQTIQALANFVQGRR